MSLEIPLCFGFPPLRISPCASFDFEDIFCGRDGLGVEGGGRAAAGEGGFDEAVGGGAGRGGDLGWVVVDYVGGGVQYSLDET